MRLFQLVEDYIDDYETTYLNLDRRFLSRKTFVISGWSCPRQPLFARPRRAGPDGEKRQQSPSPL